MKIVKPIVSVLLLIPYICFLCMFSVGVTFPDNTNVYYHGWLF